MANGGQVTYRDHFSSIFQSAVAEVGRRIGTSNDEVRTRSTSGEAAFGSDKFATIASAVIAEKGQGRDGDEDVPGEPRVRSFSLGGTVKSCARWSYELMEAYCSGNAEAISRARDRLTGSTCDPAWLTTITEYLDFFGPTGKRQDIPYITPADVGEYVVVIPSGVRIALLADWATGAASARAVLQAVATEQPQLLVHLGDVYYSGTPQEYSHNFTSPIREVLGPDLPVYILSGNHDMYCGGAGFYEAIASLNPAPASQRASFFCLRSEDRSWQLLGMDTGLHDYSPLDVDGAVTYLRDDEIDWHLRRIGEFEGRTILLSHHQLFSASSSIGKPGPVQSACNPYLLQMFIEMQASGRVSAWFWGHEHSLTIYEPFLGLSHGRCIGHGGIPVEASEPIYEPLESLRRPPTVKADTALSTNGSIYANGFAMLTLGTGGKPCSAEYFQCQNGQVEKVFSESIE